MNKNIAPSHSFMRRWFNKTFPLFFGVILGVMLTELEVTKFAKNTVYGPWVRPIIMNPDITYHSNYLEYETSTPDPVQLKSTTQNQSFVCTTTHLDMSSALKSSWALFNATGNDGIKQGEYVHVVVETRDARDHRKHVGGDFLYGVMKNTKLKKSTSGRVIDYNNGTYSVYFFAGWHGKATITIILWNTKEAIQWFDTVYRKYERRYEWKGVFQRGKITEKGVCYVLRDEVLLDKCEYRNEHAMGSTVFMCDKPENMSCDSLYLIHKGAKSKFAESILQPDQEILFQKPYMTSVISGSPLVISIKEDSTKQEAVLDGRPSCKAKSPTLMSTGFWENYNTWISLVCKTSNWTETTARTCLRGKTVYMLGDSTLRQWHISITELMKQVNTHETDIYKSWSDTTHNISVIWKFHPLMIGSKYIHFWDQQFETDVIDRIDGCNTVIVLSLTYHFVSWTTKSYLERLNQVKKAVIRLQARCPDTVVMLKSSHPRQNAQIGYVYSAWILFDINRMLRELFSDIGVRSSKRYKSPKPQVKSAAILACDHNDSQEISPTCSLEIADASRHPCLQGRDRVELKCGYELPIISFASVAPANRMCYCDQVLALAHESVMAGNLGAKKTTDKTATQFYWPGM
uniref:NXPE family member 4-like n=1 Tax=Saccoglossus kowalevskii TaxID=10224 RepID=A0ABM0GTE9_SACKO|nr:PREDICTED: NXPE family member 4-like [Saccoglossus kowalevskii]